MNFKHDTHRPRQVPPQPWFPAWSGIVGAGGDSLNYFSERIRDQKEAKNLPKITEQLHSKTHTYNPGLPLPGHLHSFH